MSLGVGIIRHATPGDAEAIVGMAAKFYATTSYRNFAPFDEQTVGDLALALIGSGVMLVAESDGRLVGMVGLFVAPFMFNRAARSAHEVVWWVDPDAQGAGVGRALLAAVEPACRELGVAAIQMVHLESSPPQAAALYEREGYFRTESCFTKELAPWQQ